MLIKKTGEPFERFSSPNISVSILGLSEQLICGRCNRQSSITHLTYNCEEYSTYTVIVTRCKIIVSSFLSQVVSYLENKGTNVLIHRTLIILGRLSVSYYVLERGSDINAQRPCLTYYKSDLVSGLRGHTFFSNSFSLASHN